MCKYEAFHYGCYDIHHSIHRKIDDGNCDQIPCPNPTPGQPGYKPTQHVPLAGQFGRKIPDTCQSCARSIPVIETFWGHEACWIESSDGTWTHFPETEEKYVKELREEAGDPVPARFGNAQLPTQWKGDVTTNENPPPEPAPNCQRCREQGSRLPNQYPCDLQRPCGNCSNAGLTAEACVYKG